MYSAYNLPHFRLVALSFGERSYDPSPNDRVKYFPHKHFTHTVDLCLLSTQKVQYQFDIVLFLIAYLAYLSKSRINCSSTPFRLTRGSRTLPTSIPFIINAAFTGAGDGAINKPRIIGNNSR